MHFCNNFQFHSESESEISTLMYITDNTAAQWREARMEISYFGSPHVQMEAILDEQWLGYLAVDDIEVTSGQCYEGNTVGN